MGVTIPIPISSIDQEQESPSLSYALDLENGRIVGKVDGLDACRQFIRKALITPRFRCFIYDNQWGSEIKQAIIAGDATPEYIESDLPRLIKEALLIDSRILDVCDFSLAFDGEKSRISFAAKTTFGNIAVEEVL